MNTARLEAGAKHLYLAPLERGGTGNTVVADFLLFFPKRS